MYSRTVPNVLRSTLVGAGVAVLLTLAAPAVAQQVSTAAYPGPPTATQSWTAQILYPVAARRAPDPRARVITQLMHYTHYSRRAQVLMVEGSFTEPGGRRWVRVRLGQRPNGSRAWVPRDAVRLASTGMRFHVSIGRRVLEVFRDGRRIRTVKVGVGKAGTPTTTGLFAVYDVVGVTGQLGPNLIIMTAWTRVPEVRAVFGNDRSRRSTGGRTPAPSDRPSRTAASAHPPTSWWSSPGSPSPARRC